MKRKSLFDLYSAEPPEMLIDEILPRQTLTGLTSKPGIGKTWLALEMARAVALGGNFLGKYPARRGSVCFVGEDSSIHDYGRQVRKLLGNLNKIDDRGFPYYDINNPYEEQLSFFIQEGLLLEDYSRLHELASFLNTIEHSQEYIRFVHPETHEDTETEIWEKGTDLIIFDTLSSMTRTNQNDNTSMEIIFRNLRNLSEQTKAAILLIHHNSKTNEYNQGEDWRGALSQIAALDNWFHLLHPSRSESDMLLLKIKKFRGLRPDDFRIHLMIDEESAKLTYIEEQESPVDDRVTTRSVVLTFLQTTPSDLKGIKKEGMDKRPEISQSSIPRLVGRALRTLTSTGKIINLDGIYIISPSTPESGTSE